MFDVNISVEDNKITSKFLFDSYFFEPHKYDYAFYLIKEGEKGKIQARWYENCMEATFDANDVSGVVFVRCFVRDKEDENARTFDSQKVLLKS